MNRPCFLLLAAATMVGSTHAADVFPGAQGFGRNVTGGRGGIVIKVTTLGDSVATKYCNPGDPNGGAQATNWEVGVSTCTVVGPDVPNCGTGGTCITGQLGSARRALMAIGPRYIVPVVSGNLALSLSLQLEKENGDFTWFGQSGFGDGIQFVDRKFIALGPDNWVVRYMSWLPAAGAAGGDWDFPNCSNGQTFLVRGDEASTTRASGIMIDHLTTMYAEDECLTLYGGIDSATAQKSAIGRGMATPGECCERFCTSDSSACTGDGTCGAGKCEASCLLSGTLGSRTTCNTHGESQCSGNEGCDLDAASCTGLSTLMGGNHSSANDLGDMYDVTVYRNVYSESELRNPKLSGMYHTGGICTTGNCKWGITDSEGAGTGPACTDDTPCDGAGSHAVCSGGLCTGDGWRNGLACGDSRDCPVNTVEGHVDLINVYGANWGWHRAASGLITGSNEQMINANITSSYFKRGLYAPGSNFVEVSDGDKNDMIFVNDIVNDYEVIDGNASYDRPGHFACSHPTAGNNQKACETSGQCGSEECVFGEICPLGAPCDAASDSSAGYCVGGTHDQQPCTLVASPYDCTVGGGSCSFKPWMTDFLVDVWESSTQIGTLSVDAGAISTANALPALIVGANRDTGDNFPSEGSTLTDFLNKARDGNGHPYWCSNVCTNDPTGVASTSAFTLTGWPYDMATLLSDNCPPQCLTANYSTWVPFADNTAFDGTCTSGGADCRCDDGTILDGTTCTSTANCGGGSCTIGITSDGTESYASGLGGYYLDADNDGMSDAWETTNGVGAVCGGDGDCDASDTTCDGWSDGVSDTAFNHLDCIEVFMAERVGELTAPVVGGEGTGLVGGSITGGSIGGTP